MMKKRKIFIFILLILICTCVGIAVGYSRVQGNIRQFQEQMDLGNNYLLEQDYEKAIVAFSRAIEIDPKQTDSYLKLAEAYVGAGDYDQAIQTLDRGYKATNDERMREERDRYQRESTFESVFLTLIEFLQKEDRDGLWSYQSGDVYQQMINGLDYVIHYPANDGYHLLIYPCGHCYYGMMDKGMRSGHGIWADYSYQEEQASYYSGNWENDYPCREGGYWTMCLAVPEDLFYEHGEYKDGLEHGELSFEYNSYDNSVKTYSYTADMGVRREVEDLNPDQRPNPEYYCYASESGRSKYCKKGIKRGITHARKGVDSEETTIPIKYDQELIDGLRAQSEEEWDPAVSEME